MAGPRSFIDQAIDNIRSNKKVNIFSNVKRCFLKVEELISVYEILLKSENYGTYNLASPMLSYRDRLIQICIENKNVQIFKFRCNTIFFVIMCISYSLFSIVHFSSCN